MYSDDREGPEGQLTTAEMKLDFSDMDDPALEAQEDNSFAVGINYFF